MGAVAGIYQEEDKRGHLIFSPSSHRKYNNSAMGDLRVGEAGVSSSFPAAVVVGDDGRPDMSSCTSVTTRPLEVISLLRTIRL